MIQFQMETNWTQESFPPLILMKSFSFLSSLYERQIFRRLRFHARPLVVHMDMTSDQRVSGSSPDGCTSFISFGLELVSSKKSNFNSKFSHLRAKSSAIHGSLERFISLGIFMPIYASFCFFHVLSETKRKREIVDLLETKQNEGQERNFLRLLIGGFAGELNAKNLTSKRHHEPSTGGLQHALV